MKYSILGFNQEKIISYNKDGVKCDLIDLLLLNYIIYAQSNPKMKHIMDKNNNAYVWLHHEHILAELPILNITDGTLKNRLTKLRKMDLITSKTVANENTQGSRTYYRTTSLLYDMLFETTSLKNDVKDESHHSKMTSDILTNNDTKVNKVLSNDNTTEFLGSAKKKPKKESLYTKCMSMIYTKTDNKDLQNLLVQWLNMLLEKYKDRNKQLYVNVFKGKLNMLDKFDKEDWKDIIEYNLQRGYEGFYPIKKYNDNLKVDEGTVSHVPSMTEEDYARQEEYLREMEKKGIQVKF